MAIFTLKTYRRTGIHDDYLIEAHDSTGKVIARCCSESMSSEVQVVIGLVNKITARLTGLNTSTLVNTKVITI